MMIPLGKVFATGYELDEVKSVIKSGWWAGSGPATKKLEDEVHKYLQLPDDYKVCAVSSCTTALQLCLEYHEIDTDVAVPSYSFVASAWSIVHAGGSPEFIDIDKEGYNISVKDLEKVIHKGIGAILPVHQYGIPADLDAIGKLAEKYNIPIIEDAACAFGSKHKGKFIGSHGNLVCFSLHARKALTSGEGGLIIIPPTCDPNWFFSMRNFGMDATPFERHGVKKYREARYNKVGYNMKMSDIQSAVALGQLQGYDHILDLRKKVVSQYMVQLSDVKQVKFFKLQFPDDVINHQNLRILVPVEDRDKLLNCLRDNEIMAKTCIQPIHKEQPADLNINELPNTEEVSSRGIWLPLYPQMTDGEVTTVTDAIKDYFDGAS